MPAGFRFHVGTSGWHYKHWLGDFYPEKFAPAKMFSWYAREFHTVEINNSFYRLPEEKTFQQWKDLAPPGFLFSVKASRFITHSWRDHTAEQRYRDRQHDQCPGREDNRYPELHRSDNTERRLNFVGRSGDRHGCRHARDHKHYR